MSVNWSVWVFVSVFCVSDFVLLLWGVNVSVGVSVYGNVGVSMGVSGVPSLGIVQKFVLGRK